jgi:uncharacterized membrane protein YkgB
MNVLIPAPILLAIGIGALDVAMNAQAVALEACVARPIMSSFHGRFDICGRSPVVQARTRCDHQAPLWLPFEHGISAAAPTLSTFAHGPAAAAIARTCPTLSFNQWAGRPDFASALLEMKETHMIAEPMPAGSAFSMRIEAAAAAGGKLESAGLVIARHSLVMVLVWIGLMKFTAYEASAIQPLVANSPLMSWLYAVFSVQATSNLIGAAEVTAVILIAIRPSSPAASVVGSLMAVATFVITLTFMFSTPGWEPSLGGFPALSVAPGQFILKDAVLLGAAIWSLGEALRHIAPRP